MSEQKTNIFQLIVQLDQLQQTVKPHLPAVSRKLVADLLADGVDVRKIARAVGRSPSYVRTVAKGDNSLSAHAIVQVIKHVAAAGEKQ